jgi:carbonic anhydrase
VPAVQSNLPAKEALARLREGNRRFASNVRSVDSLLSQTRRAELVTSQQPFATVLGCSDSRAPAEILFDVGLGELFVIRVAGNVVAPSQVGSVEFAATRFGTNLVVVMGHTGCGAIDATIEAIEHGGEVESRGLLDIVDRVRPAIMSVVEAGNERDLVGLARRAGRANVRMAVDHLRHGSRIIERLSEEGLVVVGAEYDLETGLVEFFEGAESLG